MPAIKVTREKNDKTVALGALHAGDTFYFDNCVCMLVVRNGHPFPLNLETGRECQRCDTGARVVPIACELSYKIL